MTERWKLIQGDCIEKMKELPDNSVDSVVTDPPYELGFMGKSWDSTGIAYNTETWKQALRVLKPGGHLLAFSGSRTYHRMACAIEDSGFEIRDQMMWVYGSGFPKSLNVSKAIDKQGGTDLSWFIDYILKFAEEKGVSKSDLSALFPSKNGNPTGWLWNKKNGQGITVEQYNIIKDFLGLPFENIKAEEREVIGIGHAGLTAGSIANFSGEKEFEITVPKSDAAKEWDGWGTALKPAHEPIILARKPLDGTVAANVLKWGTGAINIDGCRVPNNGEEYGELPNWGGGKQLNGEKSFAEQNHDHADGGNAYAVKKLKDLGRFPANFMHDGSQQVLDLFPNSKTSRCEKPSDCKTEGDTDFDSMRGNRPARGYDGDGSAARFFYCPKTSKKDRDDGCEGLDEKSAGVTNQSGRGYKTKCAKCDGYIARSDGVNPCTCDEPEEVYFTSKSKNNHPTVKPTELMRYLCRLVTPRGGVVLDPFNGSGSTGKAAMLEGFKYIGIEREEEYIKIAEARISKSAGQ